MKCYLIFFNILIFIILYLINFSGTFSFPSAITLPNENILVIDELGIYIYNSSINLIREEYIFPEEDKIKNKEDLSRVILKRNQGYILSIINYKIFFFNDKGEKLIITSKFTDQNPLYCTLNPL